MISSEQPGYNEIVFVPLPSDDNLMMLLDGHTQSVQSLAFSPDSQLLASGAKDGSLRLWGVGGELIREVSGAVRHDRQAIAWHPSGSSFAVSQSLEFVVVSALGQSVQPFSLGQKRVTALEYLSPQLMVVGTSSALHLWDVGKQIPRPQKWLEQEGVRAVATHTATKQIAWLAASKLCLWDITKAKPKSIPLSGLTSDVAFNPDGKLLAAASSWNVRLFDTDREAEREMLRGHKGQVTSIAFTPDGSNLVTGGWDDTVRLWDGKTGQEKRCFELRAGKVNALAISPDGCRIAVGSLDGALLVMDLE